MRARRRPVDVVAIIGVGHAPYSRTVGPRTLGSLGLRAATAAIQDAGLRRSDIDGICSSNVAPQYLQPGLGLGDVSWFASPPAPIGNLVVAAMHAIVAGACETALVVHPVLRLPSLSSSASADPYRGRESLGKGDRRSFFGSGHLETEPLGMAGPAAYAGWAHRYMSDYGVTKEQLGRIAINARSNARSNPNAVMRSPLSLADYLAARPVRDPLSVLDMDIQVDGADAFVLTSTDRAADIAEHPVLIHTATLGQAAQPHETSTIDLNHTGQAVVARALWAGSDLKLGDVDVFYPYDGFSVIALKWFESVGFCQPGEGGRFVEANWDEASLTIRIGGRVPVNPHGGSLSEGGTQGAGHLRSAVAELRSDRQAGRSGAALITPGGLFFNSQGILLRTP